MNASSEVTLLTALTAGLLGLAGYLINQANNRNERKRKIDAEALLAVRQYQDLPYRIRRRPSSTTETRAQLNNHINDVLTNLRFYHAWMQVDSREVGIAYQDYIKQTQRFGRMHRQAAWTAPIIDSDEGMREELSYQYENEPELALCLMAMRREISLWSFALRRLTQKTLTQQRKAREELNQDSR
jgi:hypothetical protein